LGTAGFGSTEMTARDPWGCPLSSLRSAWYGQRPLSLRE
jgi:hypothetical protein